MTTKDLKEVPTNYTLNKDGKGFIRIWKHDTKTGATELITHKANTILYNGADLLAKALAGLPNSGISHFYVGFSNDPDFDVEDMPAVTKEDNTFSSSGDFGYLRVPLSFPASFGNEDNYDGNTAFFTTIITDPPTATGAAFGSSSRIFALGLVSAGNPTNDSADVVFSKVQFSEILFDPAFNLTVTWGVKFLAN